MKYIPNKIPLGKRLWNKALAISLLIYGGYGIYKNDLYIPARFRGIHLHDEPAIVMYAAFISGAVVLLSVVVDHYDRRNNEEKYQGIARSFSWFGWTLFFIAILWQFLR